MPRELHKSFTSGTLITVHNPWNQRLACTRPNAWNEDRDRDTAADRETDDRRRTWQSGFPISGEGEGEAEVLRRYGVPQPGAAVRLAGMRSRSALNGKVAEVTGWDGEEGDGYVSVRLWEGKADRRGGASSGDWKKLRVHPRVLQPLRCMSDPSLSAGVAAPANDGASAFTRFSHASGRSTTSNSGAARGAEKASMMATGGSATMSSTLSGDPPTRTRRFRATALPFKRPVGPGSTFSGHSCDNWW